MEESQSEINRCQSTSVHPKLRAREEVRIHGSIAGAARCMGKSRTFVRKWSTAESLERKPGSGRKRAIVGADLAILEDLAESQETASTRKLAAEMAMRGVHVNRSTITRTIQRSQLTCYRRGTGCILNDSKSAEESILRVAS